MKRRMTEWTVEDIWLSVCDSVPVIKDRIAAKITKNICAHFNRVRLRWPAVRRYCEDNPEIVLWERPLPERTKGLTIYKNGMFIVAFNSKIQTATGRVRIVLHELGHYLLHRSFLEQGAVKRANNDWFADQFEKEADLFALMAMAPDCEIKAICKQTPAFGSAMDVLMEEYGFPEEDAVVRLAAFDPNLRKSSYQEAFGRFIE
ncbi:MAG: ImmA/IrrE family metallo-endopeptidase [Phycisphaerae bacterium]